MSIYELSEPPSMSEFQFSFQEPRSLQQSQTKSLQQSQTRLSLVQQELQDLSKALKVRNQELKEKELELQKREHKIHKREQKLEQELTQTVQQAVTQREQLFGQETQLLVKRYEEKLDEFAKENKRLHSSLKDLVQTNRQLRDQVKDQTADGEKKDLKIQELQLLLKNERDRNDRLKNTLMIRKPKKTEEIVYESKKWTAKTRESGQQTMVERFELVPQIVKWIHTLLIVHHTNKHKLDSTSDEMILESRIMYEPALSCFDLIEHSCFSTHTQLHLQVSELYLELLYDILNYGDLTNSQVPCLNLEIQNGKSVLWHVFKI
ncbi:hypothetical protein EDD86DRAFT_198662 [Gorgonomyces haynaldii]|nr:hypothetical protein EDD86DRAFT_198662 [Gorgonomyces haynaldii]